MIRLSKVGFSRPIDVPDESADYWRGLGFRDVDGPASNGEPDGYEAMKVAELRDEIERRNDGRDEDDLIPSDGKKADLVDALISDDSD